MRNSYYRCVFFVNKGLKKFSELVGDQFKYGLVFYTGSRLLPFSDGNKPFYAVPLSMLWL